MLKNILTHCCRCPKPYDIFTIWMMKNSIIFVHHKLFLFI